LASPAAVSVLRTPGASASPSGSPAVQSPLSVEELRTIVASSISQLSSRAHSPSAHTPIAATPHSTTAPGAVSRVLPSMAPPPPHRSSPPRAAAKGSMGPTSLDRQAHHSLTSPPDTSWASPHDVPGSSAFNRQRSPSSPMPRTGRLRDDTALGARVQANADLHLHAKKLGKNPFDDTSQVVAQEQAKDAAQATMFKESHVRLPASLLPGAAGNVNPVCVSPRSVGARADHAVF